MKSKKLYNVWNFIGLAIALLLLLKLLFGKQGVLKIYQLSQYYQKTATEIVYLQQKNKELGHKIERLKSVPLQTEKNAREKLGLVRPGDLVYKFKKRSAGN